MISNWTTVAEMQNLLKLVSQIGELDPPSHLDHELSYWPKGESRALFWFLRELGMDVYCTPMFWAWWTGEVELRFSLDWDEEEPLVAVGEILQKTDDSKRVIALRTVTEGGEGIPGDPDAQMGDSNYIHAVQGDMGTIVFEEEFQEGAETGYTVRFDRTGTATLLFDHEFEYLEEHQRQRAALDELTRLTEEYGGYQMEEE